MKFSSDDSAAPAASMLISLAAAAIVYNSKWLLFLVFFPGLAQQFRGFASLFLPASHLLIQKNCGLRRKSTETLQPTGEALCQGLAIDYRVKIFTDLAGCARLFGSGNANVSGVSLQTVCLFLFLPGTCVQPNYSLLVRQPCLCSYGIPNTTQ